MFRRDKIKKDLKLFDVISICVGTMISSGLFLLPGLAYAVAGPSVILAYFLAALLIVPSMLSKAELTSAMPKAGGTYYFLDRSFGPLIGTVAGIGTYLSIILKSALSLVGFGAYLVVFLGVSIKAAAIVMALAFMVLNILGPKESTFFQKIFVFFLLVILALFIVEGVHKSISVEKALLYKQFLPFFPKGMDQFFSTIGFVFVSFMGLTKVSSIAEEVKNPDFTIPWAMIISLIITTIFYVMIIFFIILFCDSLLLSYHLNPILLAADSFLSFLPLKLWRSILMVAAIFSFLSAANVGWMAASRYPLAMSKDESLPPLFSKLNRYQVPFFSIMASTGVIILAILYLDLIKIAKLASTFHLFIFIFVNLAVIVMRESKIKSYDPGFKIPFYPWVPLLGIFSSMFIIIYMGTLSILFTILMIALSLLWYHFYAQKRNQRYGAIHHWFALLGQRQDSFIEKELWYIMIDKGIKSDNDYDKLLAKAEVLDFKEKDLSFEKITEKVSALFSTRLNTPKAILLQQFSHGGPRLTPFVIEDVALPEIQLSYIKKSELIMVRSQFPVELQVYNSDTTDYETKRVHALFYLLSPESHPKKHLRILAQLADLFESKDFIQKWKKANDSMALKKCCLYHKEQVSKVFVTKEGPSRAFIDKAIKDLDFSSDILAVVINRDDKVIFPRGGTVVREGDILTVIGSFSSISRFNQRFLDPL